MKIIKAKSISKMTNEEIKQKFLSWPPESELPALVNEAYNRNIPVTFEIIARDLRVVGNPSMAHFITKAIQQNIGSPKADEILMTLLNNEQETVESGNTKNELLAICSAKPKLAAIALIKKGTPEDLTINLINRYNLNIPSITGGSTNNIKETPSQKSNPSQEILISILTILESGHIWKNELSATYMLSRLQQNPTDLFMAEIGKQRLSPPIASTFLRAVDVLAASVYENSSEKFRLRENLKNNKYPGVTLAKLYTPLDVGLFYREEIRSPIDRSPEIVLLELASLMKKPDYYQYIGWIWDSIKSNADIRNDWINTIIKTKQGNEVLMSLGNYSEDIFSEIIEFTLPEIIKSSIVNIYNSPLVHWIINKGLRDPTYQKAILNLPTELLGVVKLTPENKEILNQYFSYSDETMEDLDLLSLNKGWYRKYSNCI